MRITHLRTNHVANPLGFHLGTPHLSWVAEDTAARTQVAAQVQVAADEAGRRILYDSGKRADIDSLAFPLPLSLEPRTRYYWRVAVWADNGDTAESDMAWFETAKLDEPWRGQWITPDWEDKQIHPLLRRGFSLPGPVASARLYACGLGLYELEVNGRRVGHEHLAPGLNAYDKWLQYQTYDVTDMLVPGQNALGAWLGNGLYKGRFGFRGNKGELYGDRFALLCELVVTGEDGETIVIATDTSWKAASGPVVDGNIYDGEVYDARRSARGWSGPAFDDSAWQPVRGIDLGYERLEPRRSLPVVIKEELKPQAILTTPAGETVLDMGQNMVGWMRFRVDAPAGTEILLQHGEVLQEGNFFRGNLRSARAEYCYISNGEPAVAEPHFTFYGFRYVKISGWPGEVDPNDFTGCVVYSDLEQTGHIETSNPLVNRLALNALWGQKGNFLDVPTDCPQRDERMGWTGDAQVFGGTACYNMHSAAFFAKYLYDLHQEQKARGGLVPAVVPAADVPGGGSAAWADAATIIPWTVYLHYGDKAILEQQFESMKAWVDYIRSVDEDSGGHRLWSVGFHFGDWLALDGPDPQSPLGGTPNDYIASAYYCYSAGLVAKAAAVLGKDELAREYAALAGEVRAAIQEEYFTPRGRLAIDTQTALVLALFMDLVPEAHRPRVEQTLRSKLRKDKRHLTTGFVGTAYLCRTLSAHGSNDLAYTLLLNEDYPSWLYAVKMGATTIWERWNSLRPDGTIGDLGMNSLNHYAYGAIVEWMFRHMAGLNPVEDRPGFRHVRLAPQPDCRLKWVRAGLNSAAGRYESEWSIDKEGDLAFRFLVPFNATASLLLPDADMSTVTVNGSALAESGLSARQAGEATAVELPAGRWSFSYAPTREYIRRLSSDTPLAELMANAQAKEALANVLPAGLANLEPLALGQFGASSPRELAQSPMSPLTSELLERIDEALRDVPVE